MMKPRISWAALALLLAAAGCGRRSVERDMRAAERELERGNLVRARAMLEASISRRPEQPASAVAYNLLGFVCWKLHQYEAAAAAFEHSRQADSTLLEPLCNLAAVRQQAGDKNGSAELLEEAARLAPNDPRPLERLGLLYLQSQRWTDARTALYRALERAPRSARILTAIAVAEHRAGDTGRAISSLMQALEVQADYAPALFNLGLIYREGGRNPEQSAAYLRQFIEVADSAPRAEVARRLLADAPPSPPPQRPPAPSPPPKETPRAPQPPPAVAQTSEDPIRQAQLLAQRSDLAGALRLLLSAAERARRAGDDTQRERLLRTAVGLCPDAAEAHTARGQYLLERGDASGALASFKEAAKLQATSFDALFGLAESARRVGEIDAALVALQQAVQVQPNHAEASWMLALLYDENLQAPEKAADLYRRFARQFPKDSRALRAAERARQLEPITAVPHPEDAPLAAPTRPPARKLDIPPTQTRNQRAAVQAFNRAVTYQKEQNWERAIHYYRQSIAHNDQQAQAFVNLGTVYLANGDPDLACAAYQKAIAIDPQRYDAMYNLALIYNDLNDHDSAVQEARALLRVQPKHAPTHYLLGKLYENQRSTLDLARYHYRQFLALAPDDPIAGPVRQWLAEHPE